MINLYKVKLWVLPMVRMGYCTTLCILEPFDKGSGCHMNFSLKFLHPLGRWWFIGCWLYAGYVRHPILNDPLKWLEVSKSWPWRIGGAIVTNDPTKQFSMRFIARIVQADGWIGMLQNSKLFATRFSFNTEPWWVIALWWSMHIFAIEENALAM